MDGQNMKSSSFPTSERTKHWDAVKAMAQAAVNLELFTIPLYMTSMYSLTGMHQIATGNDFYRGRWWPGIKTTADPDGFPYCKKDQPNGKKEQSDGKKKHPDFDRMPKVQGIWYPEHPSYERQKLNTKTNHRIFNVIYKIFIEEMMHLQMAANLAKVLGVEPEFTHKDLMTKEIGDEKKSFGWHCFDPGKNKGRIPYVLNTVDLKDDFQGDVLAALVKLNEVEVRTGELDANQITLFRIIECPMEEAVDHIRPEKWKNYLQHTNKPFDKKVEEPADLPLFGSIGRLYQCLFNHLNFVYEDECNLLQHILQNHSHPYPQKDRFNEKRKGHPYSEYPGFDTTLMGTDAKYVMVRIKKLINAITEQGEGGPIENISDVYQQKVPEGADDEAVVGIVAKDDQGDAWAIEHNYKSYDDQGTRVASARGYARTQGFKGISKENVSKMDHEEIFTEVQTLMDEDDLRTWSQWFAEGNTWTAGMLESEDYKNNQYSRANHSKEAHALPDANEVAEAMNRLRAGQSRGIGDKAHDMFSQAAAGSIKGVIAVLNKYWSHEKGAKTAFPSPAMGGTADRLSICYSILGKAPDLVAGVKNRASGKDHLHHACQGLYLEPTGENPDQGRTGHHCGTDHEYCADVSLYHTCIGSNQCRAEGGCGYVQPIGGGHSCGGSQEVQGESSCSPGTYSPPSDNACAGMGGCAVPISASQLFPKPPQSVYDSGQPWALMQLHDFAWEGAFHKRIVAKGLRYEGSCEDRTVSYARGDNVYRTAWEMHLEVLESRKESSPAEAPEAPETSDIRLAFPPST